MANIYPIVEGQGDVAAVPVLLRRLATEEFGLPFLKCFPPYRMPRNRPLIESEFSKALALIHARLRTTAGAKLVLVLMDADDDCPVNLASRLKDGHAAALAANPVSIVFAVREYESWFIAANMTEQDHRDLRPVTPTIENPEAVQDAKGRFERDFLKEGRSYSETADQPKFTHCFRFANAMRAASFAKLVRDLRTALVR